MTEQLSMTVFQKVESQLDAWGANGDPENPPARPVFRTQEFGITALVDPFRKFPGTVVIYPHEGTPGEEAHIHLLPPKRRLQIAAVSHALGGVMLDAERKDTNRRIIEHTEGYGVSDHAHTVLFPARRGEGARLYEATELPPKDELTRELDAVQSRYRLRGAALTRLHAQLAQLEEVL